MKKFKGYLTAIIIALAMFVIFVLFTYRSLFNSLGVLNYVNTSEVSRNYPLMSKVASQGNNIIVLGTHDLDRYNEKTYPSDVFNYGNSDFNFTLVGNEKEGSLTNLISLGALSKTYKNDKIAILVNPLSFSQNGIKENFPSIFNLEFYQQFLSNNMISQELKKEVTDRMLFYAKDNEFISAQIKNIFEKSIFSQISIIKNFSIRMEDELKLMNFTLTQLDLIKSTFPISDKRVKVSEYSLEDQIKIAERQGIENVSNNPYFIGDTFYTRNYSANINSFENINSKVNYIKDSPEFKDYELLMKLITELKLKADVIIIPMNSKWYDYTGYDLLNRKRLYSRLVTIPKETNNKNITIRDYSRREDEPYFLKNTNQLGWKGWAYIVEDILEFSEKVKKQ